MPRTVTRLYESFQRPGVKYGFSNGQQAHITTITVPPGSEWTSELHWHDSHREFLKIIQGSALVTVGSRTQSMTASTGLITIERGVLHEWRRDPNGNGDLIVEEWTDPADGQKELFFRNLCSSILDMTATPPCVASPRWFPLDWWITLQLFMVFKEFDNYPVLSSGTLMKPTTYVVLFLAQVLGYALGLRATYPQYMPGITAQIKEE